MKTAADTFCFVALEDIGSSKWVAVERSWEWVAVATSPEAVVRLPGQVEMGILLDMVERAHRIWRRWDFTGGGGEATTHVWRHREVTLARWRGEPATEKKSIFGGPWQSEPKPIFFLGGGLSKRGSLRGSAGEENLARYLFYAIGAHLRTLAGDALRPPLLAGAGAAECRGHHHLRGRRQSRPPVEAAEVQPAGRLAPTASCICKCTVLLEFNTVHVRQNRICSSKMHFIVRVSLMIYQKEANRTRRIIMDIYYLPILC
jgi:hypothetical protein